MRRAILWVDENLPYVGLGVLVFLALAVVAGAVVAGIQTGNWKDPPFPDILRGAPLGMAVFIGSAVALTGVGYGISRGWHTLIEWAKSPPPLVTCGMCGSKWDARFYLACQRCTVLRTSLPVSDPFLEAARREVEQIAPSGEADQ